MVGFGPDISTVFEPVISTGEGRYDEYTEVRWLADLWLHLSCLSNGKDKCVELVHLGNKQCILFEGWYEFVGRGAIMAEFICVEVMMSGLSNLPFAFVNV